MSVRLSPPTSRAIALAILAVLMALIYFATVGPLLGTYSTMRDSIATLQDQVHQYQSRARELAARKAELARLKDSHSAEDGFLKGKNDTLVAAQIQNRIKALADQTRSELRSTQVLPADTEGKLRRIGVRGQMSTTVSGALRVLYGLESSNPILFIDNLDIRAEPQSLRFHNRDVGSDAIELQFDVYGYTHGAK